MLLRLRRVTRVTFTITKTSCTWQNHVFPYRHRKNNSWHKTTSGRSTKPQSKNNSIFGGKWGRKTLVLFPLNFLTVSQNSHDFIFGQSSDSYSKNAFYNYFIYSRIIKLSWFILYTIKLCFHIYFTIVFQILRSSRDGSNEYKL